MKSRSRKVICDRKLRLDAHKFYISKPSKELNLLILKYLKERYDCVVGYSGHEDDLEASVIAVVLGTRIIEGHISFYQGEN